MTGSDPKTDLHRYLQDAREALLWKLDGLTEYNIRRPMVPTGTNLLGLIKHVASVELGYFGDTFGRPSGERLPWLEDDAEPNADMWATAEESREQITGLYRRAWAHSDATIGSLALDDIGHVPWWPESRSEVTLHKILVHMIAETDRHAGQADIVRELIDGAAGLREGNDNMAPGDQAWWEGYRSRLERAAREAGPREPVQGPAREARLAGDWPQGWNCVWPDSRQRGGAREGLARGVEPGQAIEPERGADDERRVPPAVYHPRRHQLGGPVGGGRPEAGGARAHLDRVPGRGLELRSVDRTGASP